MSTLHRTAPTKTVSSRDDRARETGAACETGAARETGAAGEADPTDETDPTDPIDDADAIPELLIRPARRTDMARIAEFVSSSAEWYRPFVDEEDMAEHDVDEAWAEENFVKRDFYIGIADGEPVGTISMQYFGDWAYLGYIYLDVEHVGKGYGQALMQFAEETAREVGCHGLVLIAHPEATWAKRAYLKYGFEIIASDPEDVLAWEDGALDGYYEQGFELYQYAFAKVAVSV